MLVFCCLVFLCSNSVLADQFEDALEAYQKGEYTKAGELWKKAGEDKAEAGDSFYNVGIMYRDAVGYERNLGYAAYWFKLSAERGYAEAMFALGELSYFGGTDYPKNFNAALYWWQKGIDAGEVNSLMRVADLYIKGVELPRDLFAAQKYLSIARQSGHPEADIYWQQLQNAFNKFDVKGSRWINRLRRDIFTIEYYASPNFQTCRRFAIENNIALSAVYQTIYGDYILIGGLYQTTDEAYNTINQLPEKLRANRPRPRALSIVQSELVPPTTPLPQSWILERFASNFTAHLYTSESRVEALDFVDLFGLSNAAVYASNDGYFGVIAGVFESEQEAISATNSLPDSLRQFQPQAIRFNRVQSVLAPSFDVAERVDEEDDARFYQDALPVDLREARLSLVDRELIVSPTALEPPVPTALSFDSMTIADVLDFMQSWLHDWELGDVDAYQARYSQSFKSEALTVNTRPNSNWRINRIQSIIPDQKVELDISNLQLSVLQDEQTIVVKFLLHYISEEEESIGDRRIDMSLNNGKLEIIFETDLE